jgi:hypothetical protein
MTAKDFIVEKYPVTAKDLENKKCVGLHDIAYICEKYHESKQRELLLAFLDHIDCYSDTQIKAGYDHLIDGFLKANNCG